MFIRKLSLPVQITFYYFLIHYQRYFPPFGEMDRVHPLNANLAQICSCGRWRLALGSPPLVIACGILVVCHHMVTGGRLWFSAQVPWGNDTGLILRCPPCSHGKQSNRALLVPSCHLHSLTQIHVMPLRDPFLPLTQTLLGEHRGRGGGTQAKVDFPAFLKQATILVRGSCGRWLFCPPFGILSNHKTTLSLLSTHS